MCLAHLQPHQKSYIAQFSLRVSTLHSFLTPGVQNSGRTIIVSEITLDNTVSLLMIFLYSGCLKASSDIVNRRIMMQLFRTMTTDEKLFSRMDVKLRCTNLFIALEMSPNGNENNSFQNYLSVKNEFRFPPRSKMSKLTSFVLR